jgi:hypothetical protein
MVGTDEVDQAARRLMTTADSRSMETYAQGYDCGARWANERASWADLKALAAQSRQPWFRVVLGPEDSLLEFLAEEVWDCDPPGHRVKLGREPFIEGLMAGAACVHDAVLSRLHGNGR